MRGNGDKGTQGESKSRERLADVFMRVGGNRVSAVSVKPGTETKSIVPGYIYAYDRSTGGYEPHRFIPVSTTYRVIAILGSAIGVAIGAGTFLAECLMK
jgi:hypothetical protein